MSNSIKSTQDILIDYGDLLLGLKKDENYLAHIPSTSNNDIPNESLREHLNLVLDKFQSLVISHNLDLIIDKLIIELLIANGVELNQSLAVKIKSLWISILVFHDHGKVNEKFQVDKMQNPLFSETVDHNSPISSHHSGLSAFIFIAKYLNEAFEIDNVKHNNLFVSCILNFSYPIFRHHAKYLDDNLEEKVNFSKEIFNYIKKYLDLFKISIDGNIGDFLLNIGELHSDPSIQKSKNNFALYSLTKLGFSMLTASDYLASSQYMTGIKIDDYGILSKQRINEVFEFVTKSEQLKSGKPNYNYNTYKSLNDVNANNNDVKSNASLNTLRNQIAREVILNTRANASSNLFYIEAPTGSGKTNVSLLAAIELMKASKGEINKLYYVIPFTTLITQTYVSIIETYDINEKEIIQLHSKAGFKENEEVDGEFGSKKKNFIDNLFCNYPICLMTHIKFFDILKSNEKETNYLLHRLANSVVVIDELQSYNPSHWDKLIYFIKMYAHNYNIKFILMSATLPKLGNLEVIKDWVNNFTYLLTNTKEKYFLNPNFKDRVEFDFSLLKHKEIDYAYISSKLIEESIKYAEFDYGISKPKGSVYTIIEFIFKKSASEFYNYIRENENTFFDEVLVLSGTILEHRRRYIINYLKNSSNRNKKILLITTQVVEAGVDIDMDLGFKDKSLIDSEEQLAGRINRNVNKQNCKLFIFDLDKDAIIYGKDKRHEETKKISFETYKNILETKDFDILYNKVLSRIYEWNNKPMAIGFKDYETKINSLQFQSVHRDFKLIDQENLSCFLPIKVPVIVEGMNDKISDPIFSKIEIDFLAKFQVYPVDNYIDGKDVFEIYISIIENKIEYINQKINEKTLQGIMAKFIISLFATKEMGKKIIEFSDVPKSEYGYLYLVHWKDIYRIDFGIKADAFTSNETQFL